MPKRPQSKELFTASEVAKFCQVDLKTIHVPALVIWGEEDPWTDSKMADRLVNALPDGRLVRLPGIGRLVPEETPERMNSLLLEFMKRRAVA